MAKKFKFDGLIKAAEQQKAAAEKQQKNPDVGIKNNIVIREEFKNLIPPLTQDEYEQLEDNILKEGCRDALILWKDQGEYVLIDGHNRHSICTRHNLDFKVQVMEFDGIDAVSDWMVNNQLGKRNVTEETKSYLRGLQYNREKRKLGENQYTQERVGHNVLPASTADRLAQEHKVSEKTIKRDEKYALAIDKITSEDKTLKWNILNKTINIPKGGVTKLAEADDEIIGKVISLLSQGTPFNKAVKEARIISSPPEKKEDPRKQQIKGLKANIIASLNEAIKREDIGSLNKIKDYIQELEKMLSE